MATTYFFYDLETSGLNPKKFARQTLYYLDTIILDLMMNLYVHYCGEIFMILMNGRIKTIVLAGICLMWFV